MYQGSVYTTSWSVNNKLNKWPSGLLELQLPIQVLFVSVATHLHSIYTFKHQSYLHINHALYTTGQLNSKNNASLFFSQIVVALQGTRTYICHFLALLTPSSNTETEHSTYHLPWTGNSYGINAWYTVDWTLLQDSQTDISSGVPAKYTLDKHSFKGACQIYLDWPLFRESLPEKSRSDHSFSAEIDSVWPPHIIFFLLTPAWNTVCKVGDHSTTSYYTYSCCI